jgi:antitoxin Phd
MTSVDDRDESPSAAYAGHMRTFSVNDADERFAELLQAARQAPVTVVDHGRPAAVMLSIEDYARLRGAGWDRLLATMDLARRGARDRGLTDETLESLLADES